MGIFNDLKTHIEVVKSITRLKHWQILLVRRKWRKRVFHGNPNQKSVLSSLRNQINTFTYHTVRQFVPRHEWELQKKQQDNNIDEITKKIRGLGNMPSQISYIIEDQREMITILSEVKTSYTYYNNSASTNTVKLCSNSCASRALGLTWQLRKILQANVASILNWIKNLKVYIVSSFDRALIFLKLEE